MEWAKDHDKLSAGAALCAILLALAGEAHAQNWPTRPIKLIVPTGAGHAVDIMARILATGVSQTIGQTVFVENMPGASGFLGAQATARAEPDGYTFLFAPASLLSSNMYLVKSLPYDPARDFAAVAMVCDRGPILVTLNPDMPVKTIPELIAYGKANPGKLSYAVDASGGFALATARLLNKRGQIGMVEVPYRSSPQMVQDTISGTTHLLVGSMPPTVGAVKAGKLRWIAVSSDRRFPGLEDTPDHRGNASWVSHRRLVRGRRPRRNARRNLATIQPRDRRGFQITGNSAASFGIWIGSERRRHTGIDRAIH